MNSFSWLRKPFTHSVALAALIAFFLFAFPFRSATIGLTDRGASLETKIADLRLFEETIVPIGGKPAGAENKALLDALHRCDVQGESYSSLEDFLAAYPATAWRGALLTNLGLAYFSQGYYSKALDAYERAWAALKDEKAGVGKAYADRAIGELLMMLARLGRKERLESLFAGIEGREIIGTASERVTGAREGLTQMQTHPESAYLCGPYAVNEIAEARGVNNSKIILSLPSTHEGTSLAQIHELSLRGGLKLRKAFRAPQSTIIAPAIVHWKAGHFAPLIAAEGDQYLVKDMTFHDQGVWVSRKAIDEEASGYFLIPDTTLPDGWRNVTDEEARAVWGKGRTYDSDPTQTGENEVAAGGSCSTGGMARYKIHTMLVSLSIYDTPVGYTPPVGPAIACKVTYNQREDGQPVTFNFFNFGQKWNFRFLGYILDNPSNLNQPASVFLRGGGREIYEYDTRSKSFVYRNIRSRAKLVRTSVTPVSYERELADGSKEVYTESDGGAGTTRRIFLKKIIDPQGNTVTLNYDRRSGVRLASIVDAIGQQTTLSYELPDDPLKVTKITDPFRRSALFTYAGGKLTKITDVIGIASEFSYQGDFINILKTPYETTTFAKLDPTSSNRTDRWLETTDSLGRKERVEFRHAAPGMTNSDPRVNPRYGLNDRLWYRNTFYWDKEAYRLHVQGKNLNDPKTTAYLNAKIYHFYHTTANITSGLLESLKTPLEGRIFFQHDKTNARDITFQTKETIGNAPLFAVRVLDDGTTEGQATERNELGYTTAFADASDRITNYTYDANNIDLLKVEQTNLSGVAHQTVLTLSNYVRHRPRQIRDAAGRETHISYNSRGQAESVTNPKGETTIVTYSPNGYIQRITGPNPAMNYSFTYDDKGRVYEVTDSDGNKTIHQYDAADRIRKITYQDSTYEEFTYNRLDLRTYRDRQGRITTLAYNRFRQLEEVIDALGRVTRYNWCGCGDVESIVDGKGQRTSFIRDIQGRITQKKFHDGSTIFYHYEKQSSRLKSVTLPDGKTTNYEYYSDGNLKRVFYTKPQATAAIHESAAETEIEVKTSNASIAETPNEWRKDSSVSKNDFFNILGQLSQLGNVQDEVLQTASLAADPVISEISFTYDPVFNRLATMKDETGTTTYQYYPADGYTMGAGKLRRVDGPLQNDAIVYEYDDLGRLGKRSLNGASIEVEYDALGRIRQDQNSLLGGFDYEYVGGTRRLRYVAKTDGTFRNNFGYFSPPEDPRLKTITSQWRGSQISQFEYSYYPAGAVKTWSIPGEGTHEFTYDRIDQLTGVLVRNQSGAAVDNTTYGHDAAGNLLYEYASARFAQNTHNTLNQIHTRKEYLRTNSGSWMTLERKLSYDPNGNLTEVHSSFGELLESFEWDHANRLAGYKRGNLRSKFYYDGRNRIVRIEESESGVVRVRNLVWCGLSICEERESGRTRRFYSQGFTDDRYGKFLYTKDHLGSIREVLNTNGAIVARYRYSPYGRRSNDVQGSPINSSFGFTGHYYHEASGLYLAPFRAYSPELGRWISRDPIGEAGGINLYGYVNNSPVSLVDIDGAKPSAAEIGGQIGVVIGGAVGGVLGVGQVGVIFVTPGGQVVIIGSGAIVSGNIIAGAAIGGIIGSWVGGQIDRIADSSFCSQDDGNSGVARPPFQGAPGETVQGDKQTRRYGPDGYPETDVDTGHDHGAGDPHAHDWGRPPEGGKPTHEDRSPGRPLRPGDPSLPRGK